MSSGNRARRLGVFLFLICFENRSAAEPLLSQYDCVVHKTSGGTATVSIDFQIGGSSAPVDVVVAHFEDQNLSDLLVNGQNVQVKASSTAFRIRTKLSATGVVHIAYSVTSSKPELSRVPLFVPSASPHPERRPVHISVQLPVQDTSFGDSFPAIEWSSSKTGEIQLVAVPSLLVLHSKPTGQISFFDKMFGFQATVDYIMPALLLLASVLWLARSKTQQNRISESTRPSIHAEKDI